MKLRKLYCNKDFQNTTFIIEKGGFNVIVGESKGERQHNLGKSKLAELLDFMLLKNIDKKSFFYSESNKSKFEGYEFYLEIVLNSGQYLTIKRIIDNPTKIAFKINETESDGYILYEDFDMIPNSFDKAKNYLNELLNIDFCKENNESYRRLVNYSLRTQGDYEPKMNTVFQLRKFARNKDKDWKPLLFSLLGFDGKLLKEKYELEESVKEGNKTIKAQENSFGVKTQDKDLLVGKIQNAEFEKIKYSEELKNFNFFEQDKEIIKELVGDIEQKIADLNTISYNLEHDIDRLKKSIRNNFSFDLEKIKHLFNEVELHFPEQLSKKYEQLLEFNSQITNERNQQIRETLQEKETEYKKINEELIELNEKKEKFRELIQDTSLFKKFSVYQKKIVEIEKDISRFQTQLDAIEQIDKEKEHIEEIQKNQLEDIKNTLKTILDNTASCELYMKIRRTFSQIVKKILKDDALITITYNSNYNVEFKPNFPNSAKADGNTYYKILCVAFDLAILINYRDKSHFRFVYHDDVISGDDNGVKSRLIDTVREISERYDIQYIFSAIKDNLPLGSNIDKENIILELNDKDELGKLFKFNF